MMAGRIVDMREKLKEGLRRKVYDLYNIMRGVWYRKASCLV